MKKEVMKVQSIPLSVIDRPAVPDRLTIDPEHIRDLAASIAEIGLLSPVLLCPRDGRYEIVSGDCRYQAFLSLGRDVIPAFVQDLDAESVSISRATENLQRKDLSIIEEARIYRTLHNDHNLSWDQIAKRTGKTSGNVKRRYDLLKLPEILITAMHEKKIPYSVAEELSRLKDLGRIEYYLGYCIDHGASRPVVANWVKEELSLIRQKESTSGGGDWGSALPEQLPLYVPCEICKCPMEMSKAVSVRMCSECHATIKQNM
ncbi:MAG: ParB/RepB/Spo0J family partition protein [Ignavibacteria bacterium]|nr:ParB/RepB/Spo0J family partition protein [Ignavibacteria bacterium]